MRRCDLRGAAINVGAFELEEMPVVWEQIQLTDVYSNIYPYSVAGPAYLRSVPDSPAADLVYPISVNVPVAVVSVPFVAV